MGTFFVCIPLVLKSILVSRHYTAQTASHLSIKPRKLRSAAFHLAAAAPYLFTFLEMPGVPRTTNDVEDGINARIAELVRRHRGTTDAHKRVIVSYFLASKAAQNLTRNAT